MAITTTTEIDDAEAALVWAWKYTWAQKLKIPESLADHIASENLDLHAIEKLLRRGCPPRIAIEIVT